MRRSRASKLSTVLVTAFAFGALGLSACQKPGGPDATPPLGEATNDIGSVSFELAIGGNYQFKTLSYDISGNGFHRAATVDVSGSTTFTTLVSGVPMGPGYTAALTAQDVAHKLTACMGSATFDVTNGTTVPVPVHMTCRAAPAPSVPVPRSAGYAFALVLLTLGALRLRRPTA